jgi:YtoQ family protein
MTSIRLTKKSARPSVDCISKSVFFLSRHQLSPLSSSLIHRNDNGIRCSNRNSRICRSPLFRTTTINTRNYTQTVEDKIRNSAKLWNVYLSGEIHTSWREEIINGCKRCELPIVFTHPVLDHTKSDDCGAYILGMTEERPQWDMISAKMNAIRTQTLLNDSDIVIVKFGEQYRQWNAAYDVGYAKARNKSIITIHPPSLSHMLKEINAVANVVCQDTEEAIQTLQYVVYGRLPDRPKDGSDYIPIADRLGKGNPNP